MPQLANGLGLSRSRFSGGGFVGPLDEYEAGLRIAMDIRRRLLASYTGSAFLARADRTGQPTQAIGFKADGTWDTAALLSFAGSDSAYVVTWYDQSGNGFDFTQATAANQPRVVNAGTLDEHGLVMAGSLFMACTLDASDFTGGSGTTVQVVSGLRFSTGGGLWNYGSAIGSYVNAFGGIFSDLPGTGARITGADTTTGADHVISQERSGANHNLRVDGSVTATTSGATGSITGTAVAMELNRYNGVQMAGNLQFFCVWDNATDAAGRAAALA